MYSKSIPPRVIIHTKTYMNYRPWKFSFHLLGLKFKLKQRKVSNSFLSMRFNYPYKRQGDLYSRVVGDLWVIQHKKVMAFTLIVGKSQKYSVRWKLIAGPRKRVIHLSKVAGCQQKSLPTWLVLASYSLAFLYGWCFLNKMSLDWPLTLTTQPSTSKLSDNPDPVVQDN